MIVCPVCNSGNIKRDRVVMDLVIRGIEVRIGTPLHCCNDCGEEFWVAGVDPDFMKIALGLIS